MNSKRVLMFLFSLTLWNACQGEWPCPEADEIAPCVCQSDVDYKIAMDCSNVANDAELSQAFQAEMPFPDYEWLVIEMNDTGTTNLQYLDRDSLGPAYFKMIQIEGTTLEEVRDGSLEKSSGSLVYLILSNNMLNYFIFEALPEYTALDTLDLQNNRFNDPSIPHFISNSLRVLDISYNLEFGTMAQSTFTGCPLLEELYLDAINRTTTMPHTFSNLTSLTTLNLNYNNLSSLYYGQITSPDKKLRYLNIEDNQITILEPNSIQNMDSFGFLSMKNNDISILNENSWINIFNDLISSQVIDLSGNSLRCGCEMSWLFEEDMKVNKLTPTTTCFDGTSVYQLDSSYFQDCE